MSRVIFVAGHAGMFGSAIVRKLSEDPSNIILKRSRSELDLCDQAAVQNYFIENQIDQVYLAAAKVGGIFANSTYPADFMYDNLIIQSNVINAAFISGVKKLLFLGSSCIYPKFAPQPMAEEALLTSALEPTNEPYGIAKIAGLKLCESYNRQFGESLDVDYRSAMPTNLYGPGDNFHPENSHVIPGLIRRLHEAKIGGSSKAIGWGTGKVKREFLYIDDAADAAVFLMNLTKQEYSSETELTRSYINIGMGEDISIRHLMKSISTVVGFSGDLEFDSSKPDGPPRKLLDTSRLTRLGWNPKVTLEDGLLSTYKWYLNNIAGNND